ncbi:MAG: 1-acyl-sn-glycerol-3-phosphate acyltransferase [Bdellovibrionaceae bacterium]|nr:1-acyl-sn-glycerol-3-phosphate acyltransferase [Bdellovibrio sp.]
MKIVIQLVTLLRSILATLLFPFTILFLGSAAIVMHILFRNKDIDDSIIRFWGRICCRMSGVSVQVQGLENIPDGGCVVLFNHSSFFDVFAIAGYVPGVRFGAKAELFKVPIFGYAMKVLGTLPIARGNRQEVYKVYEEAKSRFGNKEKFALAPEGGRFYGEELAPFKAGPFIFAMSAQVPLVPLIIIGAYETQPKGQILFNKSHWHQDIRMQILAPIPTAETTRETRNALQDETYEKMNKVWKQNQPARR